MLTPDSESLCLIYLTVQSSIVKVLNPKKSNFTKPIFSTSSLSNWLTTESADSAQYTGQKSVISPEAISTPPACMPTLRVIPSRPSASSSSIRTSSSCASSFSCGSISRAFFKVMPNSNGTSFANLSTKLYGKSNTRPTSRITAFAAIVPKVTICETLSSPYFCFTYSITRSRPS